VKRIEDEDPNEPEEDTTMSDERSHDIPSGPRSEQGRAQTLEDAWRNANSVPGNSVSEMVEYSLFRRVNGTRPLAEVRNAVMLLGGDKLATEYWMLASRHISGYEIDDKAKRDFIEKIRALEPKRPEPAVAPGASMPMLPPTGDLSERIETTYGIGRELRELTERAR
jgi:hypothetical protein